MQSYQKNKCYYTITFFILKLINISKFEKKGCIFATEMKKQFFTYFFFAIYILAMIKPMLPILDYYVNYNYIATQLCENRDKPILDCNGKCYVAKEIEKSKKSNHQDTTVPEFKIDFYIPNEFQIELVQAEIFFHDKKRVSYKTASLLSNEFLFSIFHPPRQNA